MSLINESISGQGLIQWSEFGWIDPDRWVVQSGGGEDIGRRDTVNRRGAKACEVCEGQWKSRSRKDKRRMEKRFRVEVPRVRRPPFPRLITRQTETDEAEGQRWRGETAVKIERDYTDRRRENKEQEGAGSTISERGRARPRVEPDSAVRGTCSRLDHLLPPALIKFTTETDCDDAPL